MPLIPALASLAAGVTSGIGQNQQRQQSVLQSFVDNTNALSTGLELNDNLQFRRLFAQPAEGTSFQGRFDNVVANARDPGVGIQALLANSAAAQPLAERSLQNPRFGLSQGIPQGFENQLNRGFFGVNPLLQDRGNQQRLDLLGQVPSLQQTGFGDIFNAVAQLSQGNAATAANAQISTAYVNQIDQLMKMLDKRDQQINTLMGQINGNALPKVPRATFDGVDDALPGEIGL